MHACPSSLHNHQTFFNQARSTTVSTHYMYSASTPSQRVSYQGTLPGKEILSKKKSSLEPDPLYPLKRNQQQNSSVVTFFPGELMETSEECNPSQDSSP